MATSDVGTRTTCPTCGVEVSTRNLRSHRMKSHPSAVDHLRGQTKTILFVGTLVLAVIVVGYLATSAPSGGNKTLAAQWEGKEAPDFTLPNIQGGSFNLSDYRGKSPVLLFFNEGLMCAPCLRQMVDMDRDDPRFRDLGVVQVMITTDPAPQLKQWADQNQIKILTLSDQQLSVSQTYQMLGRDVSMMAGTRDGHSYLLVDKDGIVQWRADYGPGTMYVPQDDIYNKVAAKAR